MCVFKLRSGEKRAEKSTFSMCSVEETGTALKCPYTVTLQWHTRRFRYILVGPGHPLGQINHFPTFPLSCVFLWSFFAKDLEMEMQEDMAYILVTETIFHHSVAWLKLT